MAYGTNAPFGLRPVSSILGGSWTEKTNEYHIYASADGTNTYANSIFTGDPVVWGTSLGATPAADGLFGTIAAYNPHFTDGTPSTFNGAPIVGVFVGCEYLSTVTATNNLIKSPFWPGGAQVMPGTKIKAYIIDDPEVLFDVQVSVFNNAIAGFFSAFPNFPNPNPITTDAGSFGSYFALNIGGGTNFNTVFINGLLGGPTGYANNPATGSTITGQSAYYLCVDTSTATDYNNHDYRKDSESLPVRALYYTKNPNNIAAVNSIDVNPPYVIQHTPFINVTVALNLSANAHGVSSPVIVA